jgi:hypothetical protein
MSIRKTYVRSVEELKKELVIKGHNGFYEYYCKSDVLMGNEKGVEFVQEILKQGRRPEKINK